MRNITIPNSVTEIEQFVFENCPSLPVIDGIRYADTYLVKAVDCTRSSYSIKPGTRFIGDDAFRGCRWLTSITISDSVKEIAWDAFYDGCCNELNLKRVNVYISDLAKYCTSNPMSNIPGAKHLYLDGKEITNLAIPNGVKKIGWRAFRGCTSLRSVSIPSSVTEIAEFAFEGCSSLSAFYGKYATADKRSLVVGGKLIAFVPNGLTKYTIPNSVKEICREVFADCTSLTSITIPNSVTEIEDGVFLGCTSLKAFYGKFATADNRSLVIDGKLIAFAPAGLTEYTIPDGVSSIGYNAFEGCTSLTSVTIPNSVTQIGLNAFGDCTSLVSVYCKALIPPYLETGREGNNESFDNNVYGRKIYVPRQSVTAYKEGDVWGEYYDDDIVGYDFPAPKPKPKPSQKAFN